MVNDISVICYMPLHYGKLYLRESLQSVVNVVDKFVMMYTPKPSYGYGTDAVCPDSEFEMMKIAIEVLGDKLVWVNKVFGNEGEHRSHIYNYSEGFDVMVTLDADEVFKESDLIEAIKIVHAGDKWHYGVHGYINFWKSFSFCTTDGYAPIRFTNLKNTGNGEGTVPCIIYHFSCAQSDEVMRYKYCVHGHKSEIRENWLEEIYFAWTPQNQFNDVHPVAYGLWNPVPFDKNTLPDSLKQHPNFNKEIIE